MNPHKKALIKRVFFVYQLKSQLIIHAEFALKKI